MPKLPFGGGELEYTVRHGTSARYVYFRFKKDNCLEIVLPRYSNQNPELLINEKRRWIEKKYRELSKRKPAFTGHQVLFRGSYYQLEVEASAKSAVEVNGQKIVVFTPPDGDSKAILNSWLKRKAEDYLVVVAPAFAAQLGVKVKEIRVRNIGLWGYCTRRGVLAFSWQVITLPQDLAEYLVAHEVTHLAEFNHSKRFRKKLALLCPDFPEKEALLKTFVPPSRLI
ncbi:MAG: M48 family metallopeptidase [Thaumarchaeota archaeon]|nr:M48 family metallopeptidase [Nitrososphaerota archaeon]